MYVCIHIHTYTHMYTHTHTHRHSALAGTEGHNNGIYHVCMYTKTMYVTNVYVYVYTHTHTVHWLVLKDTSMLNANMVPYREKKIRIRIEKKKVNIYIHTQCTGWHSRTHQCSTLTWFRIEKKNTYTYRGKKK